MEKSEIEKYLHHSPDCNLMQNWDEAREALSLTPQMYRDEGFYEAEQEITIKSQQCTCKYNELLSHLSK